MRRTSFMGALAVIALGGVFAFGIKASPKALDIQLTGLIIMLAGIADLLLRFLIADSPLFSRATADVAAVVEPIGEPVLDVFGNPITAADPDPRPALVAPAPHTTQVLPVIVEASSPPVHTTAHRAAAQPETAVHEHLQPDQVVRHVGDHVTDESLVPVSPLTGRPLRTRRRRGLR
jgi:hypothetical protein